MNAAPDVLCTWALARPDHPAVIVDPPGGADPIPVSFQTLNTRAAQLANALLARVQPGDRVIWCGPNSLEVLTVVHAARKAGVTAVPLSYRFNADEVTYVIDNSGAKLVFVDDEFAPLVMAGRDRLPAVVDVVVWGSEVPSGATALADFVAGAPTTEPVVDGRSETGAQMIYTSGTTGKPKGALRTRSDRSIVRALLAELGLRAEHEVHLTTGPLYHSGPLSFAQMNHSLGNTVVVARKFDAAEWLRAVQQYGVTNTFSAPTQLKRIVSQPDAVLASADLSSLRCVIANAAPVPYALKEEVVDKLYTPDQRAHPETGWLFEVYGSTELGIVTVLAPADQLRKPGSCGTTYGGVRVRVVTEAGTEAAPGEPGELFIATGLEMDGYHRSAEELTAITDTEWKSVGDVAYVDAEGFVHICDRKKDMIISGGVNIYPAEIEAVVHEHPAVFDVAVIGVPDDEWGEAVHAVVQFRPGAAIDLDEIARFTAERVAGYKRPRSWEARAELPRTESGKLLKRVLRDEYRTP